MKETQRIGRFKRIFVDSSRGRGLASSLVDTFRFSRDELEKDITRRILLGMPPKQALRRLMESEEPEARGLVAYIVAEVGVSARGTGRRAEKLATMFERWAGIRERRILERQVMEFRGHLVSAILGGVLAFLSSLAPFVASFQLFASAPPASGDAVVYAGFLMTLASSSILGSFFSTGRRYIDPIIAVVAFMTALRMIAPIVSVPTPSLWGISGVIYDSARRDATILA